MTQTQGALCIRCYPEAPGTYMCPGSHDEPAKPLTFYGVATDDGRLAVRRLPGGEVAITLTWEEFRQLDVLVRGWHRDVQLRERLARPETQQSGRKCSKCGHRASVHAGGDGPCRVRRGCPCLGTRMEVP